MPKHPNKAGLQGWYIAYLIQNCIDIFIYKATCWIYKKDFKPLIVPRYTELNFNKWRNAKAIVDNDKITKHLFEYKIGKEKYIPAIWFWNVLNSIFQDRPIE